VKLGFCVTARWLKKERLLSSSIEPNTILCEMGGQVGDTGTLSNANETIEIQDTKRENNLPIHILAQLPKNITATFTATVNAKRRAAIEANHSATHLLHEALRELLGTHVEQKGSYVSLNRFASTSRTSKK